MRLVPVQSTCRQQPVRSSGDPPVDIRSRPQAGSRMERDWSVGVRIVDLAVREVGVRVLVVSHSSERGGYANRCFSIRLGRPQESWSL